MSKLADDQLHRNPRKPVYESPALLPLGELASGWGGCITGTVANGNCNLGYTVTASNCNYGSNATVNCNSGGNAATSCITGGGLTPGKSVSGW